MRPIGPIDKWQAELDRTSKSGLVDLIERLFFVYGDRDRKTLFKLAEQARSVGRLLDLRKSTDRYLADPSGETRRAMKRSAVAKKAARRRKRERKAQLKGAA